MSVVDEAVQDGVSQGGISNGFMPENGGAKLVHGGGGIVSLRAE